MDKLPKIALKNNPPGSRPPNRPPKRRRDRKASQEKEELQEVQGEEEKVGSSGINFPLENGM